MNCPLSGFQFWSESISLYANHRETGSTGADIWIGAATIDTCKVNRQCIEGIPIGFASVTCMAFDPRFQLRIGKRFLPRSKNLIVSPATIVIQFNSIRWNPQTPAFIQSVQIVNDLHGVTPNMIK